MLGEYGNLSAAARSFFLAHVCAVTSDMAKTLPATHIENKRRFNPMRLAK